MVPVHPLLVHLPIGILFASWSFYMLWMFMGKGGFREIAFYLLIMGSVSLVAAIVSGNIAEADLVQTREINRLAALHETLGMISAWLAGMLVAWALLRVGKIQGMLERIIFVSLFSIQIGVMAFSSHLGGRMVYIEGGGVEPMREPLREKQKEEQTKDKLPGEETVLLRIEFMNPA